MNGTGGQAVLNLMRILELSSAPPSEAKSLKGKLLAGASVFNDLVVVDY